MRSSKLILFAFLLIISFFLVGCGEEEGPDTIEPKTYYFKDASALKNDLDNFSIVIQSTSGDYYSIDEDANSILAYELDSPEIKYLYLKRDKDFYILTESGAAFRSNGNEATNEMNMHTDYYYTNFMAFASTLNQKYMTELGKKTFLERSVTEYRCYANKNGIFMTYYFYVDDNTGVTLYVQALKGSENPVVTSTWQALVFIVGSTSNSHLIPK